jgi:hypothetical protein
MDMGVTVDSGVAEYAHSGSGSALLNTLDDASRQRALEAVRSVMQSFMTTDGVRMPSAAWIVTARAH